MARKWYKQTLALACHFFPSYNFDSIKELDPDSFKELAASAWWLWEVYNPKKGSGANSFKNPKGY